MKDEVNRYTVRPMLPSPNAAKTASASFMSDGGGCVALPSVSQYRFSPNLSLLVCRSKPCALPQVRQRLRVCSTCSGAWGSCCLSVLFNCSRRESSSMFHPRRRRSRNEMSGASRWYEVPAAVTMGRSSEMSAKTTSSASMHAASCLLYTSDAADEEDSV